MKHKYTERPHPVDPHGVQRLYEFPNGYGASVVRFKVPPYANHDGIRNGYFSYTTNENQWEVAVLKDGHITYDTPLTDDVIGYVENEDLEAILDKIAALPKPTTGAVFPNLPPNRERPAGDGDEKFDDDLPSWQKD